MGKGQRSASNRCDLLILRGVEGDNTVFQRAKLISVRNRVGYAESETSPATLF